MNEKRLWIVAHTITGDDDYINTVMEQYDTEDDARDSLAAFKLRCIKEGNSHVPSYMLTVDGKIMKLNPEFDNTDPAALESGAFPKYIPTGGLYNGIMQSYDFDPDSLKDAKRAFTVDVRVVRTNCFEIEIEEADSEADAEEQAREQIEGGEHDNDMDYPDDMDVDIESCYET